jgi:hypothetical protein
MEISSRLLLALLATLAAHTAMAAEPFEGKWKLVPEKSRQGLPVESIVMSITRSGPNSFRTVQDVTFKSGEKRHQEFDRTYDGNEHALPGPGGASQRSVIARRLDPNTREITGIADGKITETVVSVVAADGRTMRNVEHEANGSEWISVYARQ